MIVLFMGPTACGKTSLLNMLVNKYPQAEPLVRVTTREKRPKEVDGKDYHFITVREFKSLLNRNRLVEYEEYSGNRFYGTAKASFKDDPDKIVCSTITPSGLLQICTSDTDFGEILLVYCHCSLKNQVLRYTERTKDFDVTDKMELSDRLARDEGMFKGVNAIIKAAIKVYPGQFAFLDLDTDFEPEYSFKQVCDMLENILYDDLEFK